MRKMTDDQLVHYVEDIAEKARIEGYNRGKREGSEQEPGDVKLAEFIQAIGKLPGIGQATLGKIITLAEEGNYVH